MKNKLLLLLMSCFLQFSVFAHTINYDHIILRQWNLIEGQKSLNGSFYMLKDGDVYIEDANNQLIHYPLNAFSKEDQQYIATKEKWISAINQQRPLSATKSAAPAPIIDLRLVIASLLAIALGLYIFGYADRKKFRYLFPMLLLGAGMILYSFTTRAIKSFQSITNPTVVDAAFAPFKPNVYTSWDSTWFYVGSKGIPTTHMMMFGISNHGWQQQVPIPQCYIGTNSWQIPLNPVMAANPIPVDSIHFTRGAIALAVNGIPIFNVHTNTGVDSYLDGQLDNYGGHCGRGDDYHYHIAPLHLYNNTSVALPIAYGLDGFAVFGSVEPDSTPMQALDNNHGHYFNGTYHYHGTPSAPYMIANMAGVVTEDTTHQLIPQPHANPVRPAFTPLNGALITNCVQNTNANGYTLTYTLNGNTDSVVYYWNSTGHYTFNYYTINGLATSNYNGFVPCAIPTGIMDIKEESISFSIYPNPAYDGFAISLTGIAEKEIKEIIVFNSTGQKVLAVDHFQNYFSSKNLETGIYFISIHSKGTSITKKLIIE